MLDCFEVANIIRSSRPGYEGGKVVAFSQTKTRYKISIEYEDCTIQFEGRVAKIADSIERARVVGKGTG